MQTLAFLPTLAHEAPPLTMNSMTSWGSTPRALTAPMTVVMLGWRSTLKTLISCRVENLRSDWVGKK
jgi:hypothetical protein